MTLVARFLRRQVALPPEHGAWVFLLAPLLIGIAAGGRLRVPTIYLVVAALCAFLVRQPITIGLKALTRRRSRDVLPAVGFWIAGYSALGLLHVVGLVLRGFDYVLWLAVPGIPVFIWHLILIGRREQRRQWLIEVVGAGVLALIAPAGFWIGLGRADPVGWWLWVLTWFQSVSWIFFAYLRLTQREAKPAAAGGARPRGWSLPAVVSALVPLAIAVALGLADVVSDWLWVALLVQTLETIRGVLRPAVGAKPRAIGYRQLVVSVIQTTLFMLLW